MFPQHILVYERVISMFNTAILCVPRSEAIRHAGNYLSEAGLQVSPKPAPDISHVLLPIPSFPTGDEYLAHILSDLPDDVIISGGNLFSPLLKNYTAVDFLQDPYYLAENAAITAACALRIVREQLTAPLAGQQVLIVGWGRIGKCMCRLFEKENAAVTVAARKASDRAMVSALGCCSISIEEATEETDRYDVIINTVPVMVLPDIRTKENAVLLELASKPGMAGTNILDCRGLPSKMAPDASGRLIAETFIRLCLGREDKR